MTDVRSRPHPAQDPDGDPPAGPVSEPIGGRLAPLDRVVSALDRKVPVAPTVDNRVLVDQSRFTRWAGPLFAGCAVILLPWIVVIAVTLPSRQLSPNYDVAWAGYDVLLFAALACTAVAALRRSPYLGMAASWCAGLLTADAWFDVVTAPGGASRWEAVVMAALVELPLAGLCVWLAKHSQDIAERRLTLLIRGRTKPPDPQMSPP
jgi:hypothetical protein